MIDLTVLSPEELNRFLHLQAQVYRQNQSHDELRDFRNYYEGDHPVFLTLRQKEFLGTLLTEGDYPFSHNICRLVVDLLEERLNVTGVEVRGAGPEENLEELQASSEEPLAPESIVATHLWQWWKDNHMDSVESDLYLNALRDGKAYVEVAFEDGMPRFYIHRVDDGKTGITYHKDPERTNQVLFATRYFFTGIDPLNPGQSGQERKNVYLPDQIRKYIRDREGSWVPYVEPGDEAWPLTWTDQNGEPLGIPIFEFANPSGSEIKTVLPLQNLLNKSWLDLAAGQDASGFPILAIEYNEITAQVEDDSDIEGTDEFHIAPGRAIEVENATVKRIEGANLTSMIETLWTVIAAISSVSRTPQYYLRPLGGSSVPSGEALKQLESGLVSKAEKRQTRFGQSWSDAFKMAIKLFLVFGEDGSLRTQEIEDIDSQVTIHWADPITQNDRASAEISTIHKNLGVPDREIFLRLGYSAEEIESWDAERLQEQTALVAQVASSLQVAQRRAEPQTNETIQEEE